MPLIMNFSSKSAFHGVFQLGWLMGSMRNDELPIPDEELANVKFQLEVMIEDVHTSIQGIGLLMANVEATTEYGDMGVAGNLISSLSRLSQEAQHYHRQLESICHKKAHQRAVNGH